MRIRIQRTSELAALPEYAHGPDEDAGMDLRAVERATLLPGIPQTVATGLTIELPPNARGINLSADDLETFGARLEEFLVARA